MVRDDWIRKEIPFIYKKQKIVREGSDKIHKNKFIKEMKY